VTGRAGFPPRPVCFEPAAKAKKAPFFGLFFPQADEFELRWRSGRGKSPNLLCFFEVGPLYLAGNAVKSGSSVDSLEGESQWQPPQKP